MKDEVEGFFGIAVEEVFGFINNAAEFQSNTPVFFSFAERFDRFANGNVRTVPAEGSMAFIVHRSRKNDIHVSVAVFAVEVVRCECKV